MIVHLIDGRVKGFASRGCRSTKRADVLRKRLRLTRSRRLILTRCSMCTCCRVKGFAPRGCRGRKRADVLRLCAAFHEGQWVLHWLLHGLEEAVVGAYARRFIRHEIPRSVEVD